MEPTDKLKALRKILSTLSGLKSDQKLSAYGDLLLELGSLLPIDRGTLHNLNVAQAISAVEDEIISLQEIVRAHKEERCATKPGPSVPTAKEVAGRVSKNREKAGAQSAAPKTSPKPKG